MGWVDIKHRLPLSEKEVLGTVFWAFDNSKTTEVVYYYEPENKWYDSYEIPSEVEVTHWMEIPEPFSELSCGCFSKTEGTIKHDDYFDFLKKQ